ncbi:jg12212, partial [Pararge aegeria aegeria]
CRVTSPTPWIPTPYGSSSYVALYVEIPTKDQCPAVSSNDNYINANV